MSVIDSINEETYLSVVIDRLKKQEYKIIDNASYRNQVFTKIARQTKVDLFRGGIFTTFWIFTKLAPDSLVLKQFSKDAFRYAQKTRGIFIPRSLFNSFLCFPVAIVDSIDKKTSDLINKTEPPKHWAASEKLVVFSLENRTLYYSTVPLNWGSLYFEIDIKLVKSVLAP